MIHVLTATTAALAALLVAVPAGTPSTAGAVEDWSCAGRAATIVGTAGDDVLRGTSGADVIVGGPGNDTITGGAGDDVICGDAGADWITGGEGDDEVLAGLDGWEGGSSPGGAAYGVFTGDVVTAGPGRDRIDLGADARWKSHRFSEGEFDLLSFEDSRRGVRLRLPPPGEWSESRGRRDVVLGQRNMILVGSRHADVLVGTPDSDEIYGGRADVIRGLGGVDYLDGDGATLWGGADRDLMTGRFLYGGPGNDYMELELGRAGRCGQAWGGPGRDQMSVWSPTYSEEHPARTMVELGLDSGDLSVDQRRCGGIGGAKSYYLHGERTTWRVHGSDDRERVVLSYDAGRPRLLAWLGGGDDVVIGGSNADLLDGGPGSDRANGGEGSDTCPHVEKSKSCRSS